MRIRQLLLFKLLILPAFAFTQIKIDTIKAHDRPEELSFPLIRHPKTAIAQKINNYLQSNLLGNTTKKTPTAKLFDRTKHILNDSVSRSGISICSFSAILNTQKIISIQFDIEYTGAYPWGTAKYYNFNAQNGEPILVGDIFSLSGLEALKKKINAERLRRINNYTKEIRENKTDDRHDDLDFINEKLMECLEYDTLQGFILTKNKIAFNKSNCFPHVVQNYMTNLDIELSFAEVGAWLNEYGKKVLLTKDVSIEKEIKSGLFKPFYGTIDGKYPIVLQLTDIYNDKTVTGFYYYQSQGICISVGGGIDGSDVFIEETDEDGDATASFKGTYDGKQITGTWTPKKTGKSLPYILKN